LKKYRLSSSQTLDDIREYLDDEQFRAVTESQGHVIVVAGPGSGKTRVVTHKIAYLVRRGMKPSSILLVTFTRAAAREMTERARLVSNSNLEGMLAGTFHHVCNVLLRKYARKLGYESNFTILDADDAQELINIARSEIVEALDKSEKKFFPRASVIQSIFSYMYNTLSSLEGAIESINPRFLPLKSHLEHILDKYMELKRKQNALDYDDLLVHTLHLLETDERVRNRESEKYRWVLVDEFQDTNIVQYKIVELLSSVHGNLMVVGDDAQSIYSFRGARFENIRDFLEREDTKVFKIQTNYRSTPEIVELINAIRPSGSIPKELRSARPSGPKPAIVTTWDRFEEAQFVSQRIGELIQDGIPPHEIAILYRSHSHSLELQMQLDHKGIPYKLLSGPRFIEAAHVKDILALLRLLVNPKDTLAVVRFLKLFPGIGNTYASRIATAIELGADEGLDVLESVRAFSIPRVDFSPIINVLKEVHHSTNPAEVIDMFYSRFYGDYLESTYPDYRSRRQDVERLLEIAGRYKDIQSFLSDLAVAERVDIESQEKEKDGRVLLSTVHQAKGLEWRVVFVVSVNPGDFPSGLSLMDGKLDEEERIFYVAVTRAKDILYLVKQRTGRYSPYRGNVLVVRRGDDFLKKIPSEVAERWEVTWE